MTSPSDDARSATSIRLPGAQLPKSAYMAFAVTLVITLIAALGLALTGDWVWDDLVLVQRAPEAQSMGAAFGKFFEPHWAFENNGLNEQVGYWRPLTKIFIALPRALGATEAGPHHFLSLLCHLAASWMAFRLVRRLTGHALFAWCVTFLFALHPVQVQAVGWVSSINDPLAGFLVLWSLDAFVAWRRNGSNGAPIAASIACLLAVLAKEQGLVIFPMLVVLDLLVLGARKQQRAWLAYIPFVVIGLAYWGARWYVFGEASAGFGGSITRFEFDAARASEFRVEMFGTFLTALAWPAELPFFRNVWKVIPDGDPRWLLALAFTGVYLVACIVALIRRQVRVIVALVAILMVLAPTLINYEGAGAWPVTDRALYVACLPFGALLVALLSRCLPKVIALMAIGAICVVFTIRSYDQASTFASNDAFFRRAVIESPLVPNAHNQLGRILIDQHRITPDAEYADEALLHFLLSLSLGHDYEEYSLKLGTEATVVDRLNEALLMINPKGLGKRKNPKEDPHVMVSVFDRVQANLGQGHCYLFNAEKNPETDYYQAESIFRSVIDFIPNDGGAWDGLGVALSAQGKYDEAHDAFGNATRLDPGNVTPWKNMAINLSNSGKIDESRRVAKEALFRDPLDIELHFLLARNLIDLGQFDRAEEQLQELRRMDAKDSSVPYLEGMIELNRRNWPAALERFDQAIAIEERLALAHQGKGLAMAQMGQRGPAVQALGRACELNPKSYVSHYNLASLLLADANTRESAFGYLEIAYAYSPADKNRPLLREQLVPFVYQDPDRLYGLGRMDQSRGDLEAALFWTELVLNVPNPWGQQPEDVRNYRRGKVRTMRGSILERMERSEDAALEYTAALTLNPDDLWANHNLATIYQFKLRKPDLALPLIRKALTLLAQAGEMAGAVKSRLTEMEKHATEGSGEFMGPQIPDNVIAPLDEGR
jgi:tetratricopeptide (TPR) repeat protein